MQLDDARGLIAALGNLPPELQAAGRRRVAERIAAEGVVDLAAGRVYRFKHGWIPLTHAAALRVTHGNHEKASALLARHHGPDGSHTARVSPSKHGGFNVTHRGELQAHWNSEADAVKHAAKLNGGKASNARVTPSAYGGFNVIHKGKLQGNHSTQAEADRHAARLNTTTRPKARTSERTLATRQPAAGRDKVAKGFVPQAKPPVTRTRAEISTVATERAQGVAQDRHRRLEAARVGKEEGAVAAGQPITASVLVRSGTHRGESGHLISGRDTKGRKVAVFVPGDRAEADRAVANIKAGRGPFEPAVKYDGPVIRNSGTEPLSTRNDVNYSEAGTGTADDPLARAKAAGDRARSIRANRKSAAELGAVAAAKRAEAERIANGAGVGDRAAGRLRGPGLAQAHRSTDSQLRRPASQAKPASVAVPTPSYGGYGVTELRSLFAHPDTPTANRAAMAAELRRRGYTQNASTGKWAKAADPERGRKKLPGRSVLRSGSVKPMDTTASPVESTRTAALLAEVKAFDASPPSPRTTPSAQYREKVARYNAAKHELGMRQIPGARSGGTAGGGYNEMKGK